MTHTVASTAAGSLALDGASPVSPDPIPMIAVDIAQTDIDAVVSVLRSGMLAQGARVKSLETRFADLTGADHAIACANGTCALQLAYEPLFKPGDDVLCPGWTYIATASMIVARGANPVFCDADPNTYNIDVADAERRITLKTTAIAVTHLYGNPVDIDAVQALADRHNLRVIYDAAQAHGATYRSRPLGAFGDAVTYSFYATKNMTTGEGGMVTVNSADLARSVQLGRSHGETQKYTHEVIGFNYRMSDVEAALGCSQLDRLAASTAARQSNAVALDAMIQEIPGLSPPVPSPGAEHVYHLYAVRMDMDAFSVDRDRFVEALRAEGVQCAVHYPKPVHHQPVFSAHANVDLPVCDTLAKTLFCIPVHPKLTKAQLALIGQSLAKVARAYTP